MAESFSAIAISFVRSDDNTFGTALLALWNNHSIINNEKNVRPEGKKGEKKKISNIEIRKPIAATEMTHTHRKKMREDMYYGMVK